MRRSIAVLALAVAVGQVALASVAAPVRAASSACAGKASVNHQRQLARMEDATIAANLVRVPGYCYVDIPKSEVDAIIAQLHEFEQRADVGKIFAAVSAHSVVASDAKQNTARTSSGGKETGFLELYSFTEAPPAGAQGQLAKAVPGTPRGTLELSGTKVYRTEDSTSTDSRWRYSWFRHGVQGTIDGADRAPLEKWLRRYLAKPVLVGTETRALSDALEPVPGYAYVNYSDPAVTKQFVILPLGALPSSLHQLADSEGAAAGLILAEVPPTSTASQYANELRQHGLAGFTSVGPVAFGATSVEHLTNSTEHAYVWVRDGIAGVLLTEFPDRTTPFLETFLA